MALEVARSLVCERETDKRKYFLLDNLSAVYEVMQPFEDGAI